MERLHILDGHGYIFRAYYGLVTAGKDRSGVRLATSQGFPTGALYVYASMLIRLHLELRPDRIVVVFDDPGPTFRDDIDPNYKANRSAPPDDLLPQLPEFRPLTEAFAWPVVSVPGYEADDVIASIATAARNLGWEVVIFSADKDLMRLVSEDIRLVDSMRQVTYDREKVMEKFGVGPELVSDWLSLVGDSSDNIPGVAGIGKVTASKLLNEFGSIDGILSQAHSLKGKLKERFCDPDQLERLSRSRALTRLVTNVELPMCVEEMRARPTDRNRLRTAMEKFEFAALLERLSSTDDSASIPSQGAGPAAAVAQARLEPVVADPELLSRFCDAARQTGRVAVHVEGDEQRADRARAVGVALALPTEEPIYVPLSHRYLGAPPPWTEHQLEPLRQLLADTNVLVDSHDTKTALRLLSRHNMTIASVGVDTMVCSYLVDASRDHSVDTLARTVGIEGFDRALVVGAGKHKVAIESVSEAKAAQWAGTIAGVVARAVPGLLQQMTEDHLLSLWQELEAPLVKVLAAIEDRGVPIDVDFLAELAVKVSGRIAEIEARVFELAGETFNLGSPKQLREVLFGRLKLRSATMKKNKTGHSVDHDVLVGMRGEHAIIEPILEHRELVKLKGTYIDALPPLRNSETGRVHTVFRQAVAATGRLSSQEPNLQNIPIRTDLGREVRRAFVAAPGMSLVSADFSQIELRVMAHLSRDPVLNSAFVNGVDVHQQTASEVFGVALNEVLPHQRRIAKAVNYGLIYGQSEFGLARALSISRDEARAYIETYFERFTGVREFMNECVATARKLGYAQTVLGRRRHIPNLRSKNYQQRSAAERVAQNTPMQGSAADIMKLAMLGVDALVRTDYRDCGVLLTVHDELVLEAPKTRARALAAAVKEAMQGALALRVPLQVDVGIADNWADAH